MTLPQLRAWAADQLADYKLPEDLVVVAQLPRGPAGKVLKRELVAADDPAVTA